MKKEKKTSTSPATKRKRTIKNQLEGITKDDMELVEPVAEEKVKPKHMYVGYQLRITVLLAVFFVLIYIANVFLIKSVQLEADKTIKFDEQSNIDYKIKLAPNTFYEQQYLDKNMSYVASLIEGVVLNFNYNFNSEKELSGEYKYRIVANLLITNKDTNEEFLNKSYVIKDFQQNRLDNQKTITIYDNTVADYAYFNNIANGFKSTYGVDADCKVVYSLEVVKSFDTYSFEGNGVNNTSISTISIPLSQKAVSIKLDSKNINNHSNLTIAKKYKFDDIRYLIVGVVLSFLAIAVLLKSITLLYKLQPKKSNYDKELSRILREYDRLIVNTDTMPKLEEYTVTKLNKFDELLDARDNLNKPIFFFEVARHSKCYFFIKNDNELILYKMKNLD